MDLSLRPFQRRAVRALESGKHDVVIVCLPRAQGKSTLAALLCHRCLTKGDSLYRPGTESHLVAATIDSSRKTCFKLLRRMIEDVDPKGDVFRIAESSHACHVRRKLCNTRVSVVAPTSKATLGLVGVPLVVVDEPGAYDLAAGAEVWDSLRTSVGKPASPLRVFVIGHLAPRARAAGHWYFDLVARGSYRRTWVHAIQADPAKWDHASEIRRCSPLSWSYPDSRAELFDERDEARVSAAAKARFLSYRLNVPTDSEAEVVFTPDDWEAILARPVPPPVGRPIVGLDAGSNRSWSMASIAWRNGRLDAVGVIPGVPDIAAQERRDGKSPGIYQALVDGDRLTVETGRQVVEMETLIDRVLDFGPAAIVCDNHRLAAVEDAVGGRVPVVARRRRWSESTDDIVSTRKLGKDGTLAVVPEARGLYWASLGDSLVVDDDFASVALVKRDGKNQRSRDDLANAMVLALGHVARLPPERPFRVRIVGQ